MLDIVGKRYWFFLISLIVIVPGLISLALFGLRFSIDFTSGTLWELSFQHQVMPGEVKTVLADNGLKDATVQTSGQNGILIRLPNLQAGSTLKTQVSKALTDKFGQFTELRFESVGPLVSSQTTTNSIYAVAAAAIGILAYISFAFRKVKRPVRYGVCAIIAMLHDGLLVLGVFSILGRVFGIEVDSLFVTALLTVIGFSVHDTIVVFDRIRENATKNVGGSYEDVVNHSLLQTMARSVTTSLTVIVTLSALFLFGGTTIHSFVLALLIGIVSGTYSSIFNASLLLVVWENGEVGNFFRRFRRRQAVVQGS
ncbi:MAG: protein translocase subunit SecF [Chloroflexi bacterium]|nr:protein translocase subunit SecF [Chloroflexota bacterium]